MSKLTPLEQMFISVFDRQELVISQMRHQLESYEQTVVCNLTAAGRKPPEWLLQKVSAGSDAVRCSDVQEYNGKQIPDILLPSNRFTTPTSRPTFSIPSLNPLQNITNKQIHTDQILEEAEEEIPNSHSENHTEKEQPFNSNLAIQLPNSVTRRSRSRQKAIEKRLSDERKTKRGKSTLFKPSERNEECGVDRPVCTENEAVEPKRLLFDGVVFGNLGNEDDSRVEKKGGEMKKSSNLANESGFVVEKEEEMEKFSNLGDERECGVEKEEEEMEKFSNLGDERDCGVEKEEEEREISSPMFENTNCEVNETNIREINNDITEHDSLSNGGKTGVIDLSVEKSGVKLLERELNETSNRIENRTTEQESTELLNCTEIDADEVGKIDVDEFENTETHELMENENRTEIETDKVGINESHELTEVENSTENDADELQKNVINESVEIQNHTENDANDKSAEIPDCMETGEDDSYKLKEVQNCAEIDADELDNHDSNEQTQVLNHVERDTAEVQNTEQIEIPDCTEINACELEKTAIEESSDIPKYTENDTDILVSSNFKEPTEITDCTEINTTGFDKPCFEESSEINEYEAGKTALDESTEITHCTEIDASEAEKSSLKQPTEIPNCTEFDAVENNDLEAPPMEVHNKLEIVFANDSHSPVSVKENTETLICTENDVVELKKDKETRVSVGEMNAVLYARDSYSPIGNNSENRGEMMVKDDDNNVVLDEQEKETEIDSKSVSELLKSSEVVKHVESGGNYILQGSITNENDIINNRESLESSVKRQVDDVQVNENVDFSSSKRRKMKESEESFTEPSDLSVQIAQSDEAQFKIEEKGRKIEKFFLDSGLAAYSGRMKEKEESFTDPSYLSVTNAEFVNLEAQLQTEELNSSEPNYSPLQNDPSQDSQLPISSESNSSSLSTKASSKKDKSPLTYPANFPISPHKPELDSFNQEPELEGFSMEISPIPEDQTVNLPEILSLQRERASLIEQLFSSSKNASSSGPNLSPKYNLDSNMYQSFEFMKSNDPLDPLFEYNRSGTGFSFSGKSEKSITFTPPAVEKFGRNVSSGKLKSSSELTCFRIDEDSGIEETEVPNYHNAPHEENPLESENDQNAPQEDNLLESGNDLNAPQEENLADMDISEEMDVDDSQIDRTTLEESSPEEEENSQETETSQLENDQNTLRDLTGLHKIHSESVAGSVLESQGQLRNYTSMKPKHSAASSIKASNDFKKGVKLVRAGSKFSGSCINDNNNIRGSVRASSNIVSHVSSFIPMVKKQQPPANKKREIRVPALEAAEAKKKLDEKKRNLKEMQKLEREREMKRKIEDAKKKQEEEQRKKKEAELANRKRQREEREKKDKEEREKRRKIAELASEKISDEKEAGSSFSVVNKNKIEIPKKLKKEKEYEMSPYQDSDDEGANSEEDEKKRISKYIPPWARKGLHKEYYISKLCIDPVALFNSKLAFNYNGLQRRSKKSRPY